MYIYFSLRNSYKLSLHCAYFPGSGLKDTQILTLPPPGGKIENCKWLFLLLIPFINKLITWTGVVKTSKMCAISKGL